MRNTKKKGFTIIELVVVVAVIAILAAVLIPTFSGIIAKAKLNKDEQAIANMNKIVAMADGEEEFVFAADAVNALYADGFNAGKLVAYSKGYHYAYGGVDNNKFYLLDTEGKIVFPKNDDTAVNTLWAFFNNAKADYVPGVEKYIALSAITNAETFTKYDCAFRDTNANYTLDLNGMAITVGADGKKITLKNGAVSDSVSGYTLDSSAVKKTAATAASIKALTPDADGAVKVDKALVQSAGTVNLAVATDAKKVVFENCTFDLSAGTDSKHALYFGTGAEAVESYEFINCTFNLNQANVFIRGNAQTPDVTIKGCTLNSGRGFVFGDGGNATNKKPETKQYGNIVIEGNTFIDNGSVDGKPFIQFAANGTGELTAAKISIKNNTFSVQDIAIRIHETVQKINCSSSNIVISGNTIPAGAVAIDGDGAKAAQTIADAWIAKMQ